METHERLALCYNYLRSIGRVHTQKEAAEIIGCTPPNFNSALKGDVRFLTTRFLTRFVIAFPIFSLGWLISGDGEMLQKAADNKTVTQYNEEGDNLSEVSFAPSRANNDAEWLRLMAKKDEQIDRLLTIIERMQHATATATQ